MRLVSFRDLNLNLIAHRKILDDRVGNAVTDVCDVGSESDDARPSELRRPGWAEQGRRLSEPMSGRQSWPMAGATGLDVQRPGLMTRKVDRSATRRTTQSIGRDQRPLPKWNRHPVEAAVQSAAARGISRSPLRDRRCKGDVRCLAASCALLPPFCQGSRHLCWSALLPRRPPRSSGGRLRRTAVGQYRARRLRRPQSGRLSRPQDAIRSSRRCRSQCLQFRRGRHCQRLSNMRWPRLERCPSADRRCAGKADRLAANGHSSVAARAITISARSR